MYDELVSRLHKRIALTTAGSPLQDDLREAADAIEELSKDLERSKEYETFWEKEANEALKKFQTTVASIPRWIPVTERLPKEMETVIVTTGKNVGFSFCVNDYGTLEFYSPWNITHWMPLPEPPKEG